MSILTSVRVRALAGAVTGLLLVGGLALGTAPAAVAVPAAPTGLTSNADPVPVLSWDRVPGAAVYNVQGSESPSFSSTVFSVTTPNSRYVPTRVLKGGAPLYWRVQASDNSAVGPWSDTARKDIGTHAPPTGLAVHASTGTTVLPPVAAPVITWDSVPGALSYDIEGDTDTDGVGGTPFNNIKTTSFVWPDPQGVAENSGARAFYVRVRAKFDNGLQTDWSAFAPYEVRQLPPVTLTSEHCRSGLICAPDPSTVSTDNPEPTPRDSGIVQDVVFDWDPVKGATRYELWVALDDDFNNEVQRVIVTGTRYSPPITYDNNNYFWKVRPINATGEAARWPTQPGEFQRRWPPAPQLVWPADSTTPVGDDFYFQWDPVTLASRYQLELGTDPNFSPGSYTTCATAQTTYVPSYNCVPAQGKLYYWRVKPYDAPRGVEGFYSEIHRFVYDSGRVTQTGPSTTVPVDVPTLTWQPSKDAQTYEVVVKNKRDQTVASVNTSALSWTPDNRLLPEDGPFSWTVIAVDGNGSRSPLPLTGRPFQVTGAVLGGGDLAPTSAARSQTSSRFPQLSWTPVTDAAYYRLHVRDNPSFQYPSNATGVLSRNLTYPTVTDDSTFFLKQGTYTWWVDAYASDGQVLATGIATPGTFVITPLPAVTGQSVALDGRALDAGTECSLALTATVGDADQCENVPGTPVLDWDAVPGAGGYLVYLAEDADFTNRVLRDYATVTTSRWAPSYDDLTALADNQSGKAYYWFVRPCVSVSPVANCGPDPISLDNAATNAFRKLSPQVKLLPTVQDGVPRERGSEVTFSWEDYLLTNQASPAYYGASRRPFQSATNYRLQVSRSSVITDANAIDDVVVDQTTYTSTGATYPEGELYWRVQAIDSRGNRLAWSEVRRFVKATPALNLDPSATPASSPLDEISVEASGAKPEFNTHLTNGEVQFSWSAQDFDVQWRLEVYKDNETNLSPSKLVYSTTVKQAAIVVPTALPPSSEPYRWRVKRLDFTGQDDRGRWSDFGKFYVDPQNVSLIAPATGTEQPPNGPLLTWAPYSVGGQQASYYSVEILAANGTSVGSVSNTPATAWAPTATYANGTYTWRVQAFDTSANQVGSSAPRTFVVDTQLRPSGGAAAIQAPGGAAVGRTLTSTPPTWNRDGVAMSYQWLRDGSPISGATATTYVAGADDQDKTLSLRVTGQLSSFLDGTSTSNGIAIGAGTAPVASSAPRLTGVAAARETLSVDPGGWPSNARFTYQWFVGDQAVARETSASYTVRSRDAGLPVKARVTASVPGLLPSEAFSDTQTVRKLTSTTTASTSAAKITQRQRAVVDVHVSLVDYGIDLGGVEVLDGKKVVARLQLKTGGDGSITVKLKKLKAGKHKITVRYLGNAGTDSSQSKPLKLSVTKK